MGKIFISYRREDSFITAGKIYNRLEHYYGQGSLYMDIEPVPFNNDFHQNIEKEVINSDVVLVIIGPNWLTILQEKADTPDDTVRIEIEVALHHTIPTIPIFLGSRVNSLKTSDLQEPLSKLAEVNGIVVDPGKNFRIHMDRLRQHLDEHFATLSRDTGPGSFDLDEFELSQDIDIATDTQAVTSSLDDEGENSLQDSILEGWDDEAEAQQDGTGEEPNPDAIRSNRSSNRLEPEVVFDDGAPSKEWDGILSDLETDFGLVLSQAERLEADREQLTDSEGEIELEFELHELEEGELPGSEVYHSADNGVEAANPVDLPERPEEDTLVLNIDDVSQSDTLVLNTDKVSEGGTLILSTDELPEEGISDRTDPNRILQQEVPKILPAGYPPERSQRGSNAKKKPEGEPDPLKKSFKKIYAVLVASVVGIALGLWFWSDHFENSEKVGPRHTMKLSVLDTKSSFVENEAAGNLLILTGTVHNRSSLNQKLIQLEGSAYAKGEVLIATELAYAGRVLSEQELKTLPLLKIHNRLVEATGREAEISVSPERSLPFMIVLGKLPDDIEAFTVRIARSSIAE